MNERVDVTKLLAKVHQKTVMRYGADYRDTDLWQQAVERNEPTSKKRVKAGLLLFRRGVIDGKTLRERIGEVERLCANFFYAKLFMINKHEEDYWRALVAAPAPAPAPPDAEVTRDAAAI